MLTPRARSDSYVNFVSESCVVADELLLAFWHVHRRLSARTWPLGRFAQSARGAVVEPAQVGARMHLLEAGHRSVPSTSVRVATRSRCLRGSEAAAHLS